MTPGLVLSIFPGIDLLGRAVAQAVLEGAAMIPSLLDGQAWDEMPQGAE